MLSKQRRFDNRLWKNYEESGILWCWIENYLCVRHGLWNGKVGPGFCLGTGKKTQLTLIICFNTCTIVKGIDSYLVNCTMNHDFTVNSKLHWYFAEPEYDFTKPLRDTDAHEKETGEFECEVSDPDARVTWYREDQVWYTLIMCRAYFFLLHTPAILIEYLPRNAIIYYRKINISLNSSVHFNSIHPK